MVGVNGGKNYFKKINKRSYRNFCSFFHVHLIFVLGTIAPARELQDVNASDSNEDPMKIFIANLNLVVPVVAAVLVIIVAVIVICVLKGKDHDDEKGA